VPRAANVWGLDWRRHRSRLANAAEHRFRTRRTLGVPRLGTGELACVRVLKPAPNDRPEVKIRSVDDQYEGREDWVSPTRLKVRWKDRARFIAAEQRWHAVEDASAEAVDTLEANTCILVFDHLKALQYIDWRSADRSAVLMVEDLGHFEAATGLKREDLLSYPTSYGEDDKIVAPWPALRPRRLRPRQTPARRLPKPPPSLPPSPLARNSPSETRS
jgi:hypothetical protein